MDKIGIIDVDSHNFPNLALMKISAYEKSKGNHVEMLNQFEYYDKVYQAKIFDETYSKDYEYEPMCDELIKGGTGYKIGGVLPYEVEHICPDYELYGIKDNAIGFLTRGCPRHCAFCIVGDKEGLKSEKVADLGEFWSDQKEITIMDSNLTACEDFNELVQQLIDSKRKVNFLQGLDIRFMTEEKANLIGQVKTKMIHFAWDNYEFKTYEKLKKFRPYFSQDFRKLRVYVLTNFNTTMEQNLERIYKLKEIGYDPFVMIYDKPNAPKEIRKLQRWVNNKFIFRTCDTFDEYMKGK